MISKNGNGKIRSTNLPSCLWMLILLHFAVKKCYKVINNNNNNNNNNTANEANANDNNNNI